MGTYNYKAFISYSHKDDRWGRWLHRRLENYPLPKNIVGNVTKTGLVPKRLTPIFRDREELAAADSLGEKIEQALSHSENLIMICSPAAARSHWVNQEVLYFKRHNRGAQIFSVIVEGEPFASNIPGREDEECFPPALRYQLDGNGELSDIAAEPLAADVRDHADGKRLGVLKLVSGMIGVGLDEVVQRDMRRNRKRVMAITSGALATVLAMGTLTAFAMNARAEAEVAQAEAEAGRNDAEESIEFMLTDLKPELEKVGRLDALKVVGKRAEAYYDKYPISKHSDDALGRRARVFHFLGNSIYTSTRPEDASEYFQRAYESTNALLMRSAKNSDKIYIHAQSAFWMGYFHYKAKDYLDAKPYFEEYLELAKLLNQIEPNKLRSKQELTYAVTNMGTLLLEQDEAKKAYNLYLESISIYEQIAASHGSNIQQQFDLGDAYAWLADACLNMGDLFKAYEYREIQRAHFINLVPKYPKSAKLKHKLLTAELGMGSLAVKLGKYESAIEISSNAFSASQQLTEQDPSNIRLIVNSAMIALLKAEVLLVHNGNLDEITDLLTHAEKLRNQIPITSAKNKAEVEKISNRQSFIARNYLNER